MKEKIKKWYRQGLWGKDKVRIAAERGLITAEEYTEITGEKYA